MTEKTPNASEAPTSGELDKPESLSEETTMTRELTQKKKDKKSKKKKRRRKAKPEKPGALRALKFELDAFRAELKHILRMVKREVTYFVNPLDVAIILIMYSILVIFIILGSWVIVPTLVEIYDPKSTLRGDVEDFWTGVGGRILIASGGLIIFFVRLVTKSGIVKFKNKVNSKKFPLTYVFGTSSYAEYLIRDITKLYGEEEKFVLIADKDLIWVRQARALMDAYIVENKEEFLKENFYELVTFQNAKEFLILTDEVELNQSIMTHLRGLTNFKYVDGLPKIIMLSETAPTFLRHRNLEEENIVLVNDLDAITDGLVLSLSLDIRFPRCIEIPAVRTFVGWPAIALSNHVKGINVLAINRNGKILPPKEEMLAEDRLIIYVKERGEFDTKRTRRITQELPASKETSDK